jgi:hypothetical protein
MTVSGKDLELPQGKGLIYGLYLEIHDLFSGNDLIFTD